MVYKESIVIFRKNFTLNEFNDFLELGLAVASIQFKLPPKYF